MKNRKVTQLFAGLMVTALVLTGGVVPPTTALAATKTVNIKTQKQLQAALKDPNVTKIVIKTSKGTKFTIEDGDYGKKSLVIESPKATVNNYGDFKKIDLKDAKTVYDRGDGNKITVRDTNSLKLVAGKQAFDTKITIAGKGGKIDIVNNGVLDTIDVKGKSSISLAGKSEEVPTITNNAKGSKIVTNMDANVVLNKSADVVVKAGASLDSLTMKADAKVTIAKGAIVKEVEVTGKAENVTLKINGTVENVVVESKVDIAVTGSTNNTVAITNNAEGATIKSEVKTDVTLNADAKVSLDKGAEGSSVSAGNDSVKPDVTNNTSDKITVTDSNGKDSTVDSGSNSAGTTTGSETGKDDANKNNTSGGTTGGSGGTGGSGNTDSGTDNSGSQGGTGNTGSEALTFTVTVAIDGEATTLVPGTTLRADAEEKDGVTYTYVWKRGNEVVGSNRTYQVSSFDSGYQLTVMVTGIETATGKTGTETATSAKVKYVGHVGNNSLPLTTVKQGTDKNGVLEVLPSVYSVEGENDNFADMSITWEENAEAPFNGAVPGTYTFTGTIILNSDWVWAGDVPSITATVMVVGENAIEYNIVKPDHTFTNNDSNGQDTSAETKENQDAFSVSKKGTYDWEITGTYLDMKAFGSSVAEQGVHKWIAVNINVGKDVKDHLKFGSSPSDLKLVDAYEPQGASNNEITLWLRADELKEAPVTRYILYVTDDTNMSAITPITISFKNRKVTMTGIDTLYDTSVSGGTYGSVTDRSQLNLPSEVTLRSGDKTYEHVALIWSCNKVYGTDVGTFEFSPTVRDNDLIDLGEVILPKIHVTVAKAAKEAPADGIVSVKNITHNSFTIEKTSSDAMEYFVSTTVTTVDAIPDDANWSSQTTVTADPKTTYYVYARYPETDNYLSSAAKLVGSFVTPSAPVNLSYLVPGQYKTGEEFIDGGSEGAVKVQDELGLPETLRLKTTADGTEVELPVNWECGTYNATAKAGTYHFTAKFNLEGVDTIYTFEGLVIPTAKVVISKAVQDTEDETGDSLPVGAVNLQVIADDEVHIDNEFTGDLTNTVEGNTITVSGNVAPKFIDNEALFSDSEKDALKSGFYVPLCFAIPDGVDAANISINAEVGNMVKYPYQNGDTNYKILVRPDYCSDSGFAIKLSIQLGAAYGTFKYQMIPNNQEQGIFAFPAQIPADHRLINVPTDVVHVQDVDNTGSKVQLNYEKDTVADSYQNVTFSFSDLHTIVASGTIKASEITAPQYFTYFVKVPLHSNISKIYVYDNGEGDTYDLLHPENSTIKDYHANTNGTDMAYVAVKIKIVDIIDGEPVIENSPGSNVSVWYKDVTEGSQYHAWNCSVTVSTSDLSIAKESPSEE